MVKKYNEIEAYLTKEGADVVTIKNVLNVAIEPFVLFTSIGLHNGSYRKSANLIMDNKQYKFKIKDL